MYDVYGTRHELEIFTKAVNQWDIKAMEDLPEYMRACYLALLDFWKKLCESYFTEARWFYSGYTPTLEEYLENAWISIGGPEAIVHAYILQEGLDGRNSVSMDHCLKQGGELLYWSSLITRMTNDLGTCKAESARGDIAKSIECYMVEAGASREEAIKHVRSLLFHSWKKLNEESYKSSIPRSMAKLCLNMARTSHCIYHHGDGIGTSSGATKDLLMSLIVQTIN
ncbi:putative terpene synthase 9 [Hibiscus syriacus]|uniref:Terpene synthase 9 n=1 Tax=Hibiscus syriacus TaxID=106335 RepID=A0A6A3CIT6_HIBSY|nr:putative terpene synthase 9 [Hibiscus syriacus]